MLKRPGMASNELLTLKSKDKTAPNLLIVNKNVITIKNYIAEKFIDFFVNIGSNLASKKKRKRPFNTYLRKSVVNTFSIDLFTNLESRN